MENSLEADTTFDKDLFLHGFKIFPHRLQICYKGKINNYFV